MGRDYPDLVIPENVLEAYHEPELALLYKRFMEDDSGLEEYTDIINTRINQRQQGSLGKVL